MTFIQQNPVLAYIKPGENNITVRFTTNKWYKQFFT